MQIQKENIKQTILMVAKEEFLSNGFKNTSMRVIAKKSGVSLSNIYNYYENKDDLLQEVLSPLLQALEKVNKEHNSPKNISLNVFTSEEFQFETIRLFVDFIEQHKRELALLLFHSHGSSFENFKDKIIDRNTRTGLDYLKKMKIRYPQVNIQISEFFLHTVSSWNLSIMGEIISHDLNHNEIEHFISDYIAYSTAGWKKIMQV